MLKKLTALLLKNNGSTISTYNVTDDGDANQKIDYAYYLTTSQEIDEIFIVYDDAESETITVKEIEECKFSVYKIVFLNRWGAFQDLFYFKKSVNTLDSRSEDFNRSIF